MNEPRQQNIILQLLLALPISLLVFLLVLVMLLVGFEVAYADRVYPGVYLQQVDLSGLTAEETEQKLTEALRYASEGSIQFIYQDQVWQASPAELGFTIDVSTSTRNALDVGRGRQLLLNFVDKGRAWFTGVQLSPVGFYDERVAMDYLQALADDINQPLVEASLLLESAEVVAVRGQVGRQVDIPGTLALLKPTLMEMQGGDLPLLVTVTQPEIMDVGPQAELARQILSEPLVLTADGVDNGAGTWTIPPETLGAMLIITRSDGNEAENAIYQITVNETLFDGYLSSLSSNLSIEPVNARFTFNPETSGLEVLEPAIIGRELDVTASIQHINEQLINGRHEIPFKFTTLAPGVTDDTTGEELGITEEIRQYTSYFHTSDPFRVQNIRTASARFHGLLIAPGETFSMVQALGDISLDNGYAEAPIIFGGRTIQGIGGGICQVSTTLFRAAFDAGFPIVERHPHSYRVGYYEQRPDGSNNPQLAGLDASVYVPIVDLKFTNDTEHWVLMETIPGNVSLTWKFYSMSDGRTVEMTTTGLTNVVPAPETLYRENPELEKNETKRVDYARDGADVRVNRTVYKDGQIHFSDSFFTRYQAWQEIIEYGPGTEGIPGVSD